VKRLKISLEKMGQEIEILSASDTGTQRTLATLQKDFDSLPTKVRASIIPDLSDFRNRLSKLEHDRAYNARSERSGCSSNTSTADDSLRNLVEDRLATFDIGLARVSNELREQAGMIEDVKGKQDELSNDLQGKLRRLITKVNSKCEEGFALPTESDLGRGFDDISTPKMARDGAVVRDAPRLLGSHMPSHSSPKALSFQAAGSLSHLPVSRSQSCGTLWQQASEPQTPKMPDAETTLQALREENLRLREANLEIREQAISSKPSDDVAVASSSGQVCPVAVVAPVVQTLPPAAPVQRVGVRRLSAYEAPRSPVMRMASQGARSPTLPTRGVSQVVREVSAPMKGQVLSKTIHGSATPQQSPVLLKPSRMVG